jgi:hypothetical protein
MNSNRNSTHFTVHRAESVVPTVRRSTTSHIYWISLEGSEMGATLHFEDLASIIDWTQTLTASAIAMMAEVVAERTVIENAEDIELVTQAIRHA